MRRVPRRRPSGGGVCSPWIAAQPGTGCQTIAQLLCSWSPSRLPGETAIVEISGPRARRRFEAMVATTHQPRPSNNFQVRGVSVAGVARRVVGDGVNLDILANDQIARITVDRLPTVGADGSQPDPNAEEQVVEDVVRRHPKGE